MRRSDRRQRTSAGSPARTEAHERLARRYERFATREAPGRSPLYEQLAHAVAQDAEVLDWLLTLPEAKRQPNLLFAAVRYLYGTADGWPRFRAWWSAHRDEIARVMRERRTQTNEPARCATLLPLLAPLPQPLALIEVGASAGLCLLPDCYEYRFDGRPVLPVRSCGVPAPVLACRVSGHGPAPARGVDVMWRAGLDLDPVDVRDERETAWLEALVWPGAHDRVERLRAALAVAPRHPPRVERGDLRTDLPALLARLPANATPVVFHSAALLYVADAGERAAFAELMRWSGVHWISNEAPGVVPGIEGEVPPPAADGRFLLAMNGRAVAWTDPHGAWLDWLPGAG